MAPSKHKSGGRSQRPRGAAFDLRTALAHAVQAYRRGRPAQAERELREIVARAPGNATCLYNLGYILQLRGKFAEAAAQYRRVLTIEPDHVDARFNLANALHADGHREPAEAAFRALLAECPAHAGAWNNLGNLLDATQRPQEAEDAYRRALEIEPASPRALLNLGRALARGGRTAEAEKSIRAALGVDPGDAEAHRALASVLEARGRDDAAEASLRESLRLDPDAFEACLELGALMRRRGRLEAALELYARALARHADVAELHHAMGVALHEAGRVQEAEQALREAVRLRPDFADAYSNLGVCLMDRERVAEAEGLCRKALELDPELASAGNNLGMALAAQGRREEAEAAYRDALRQVPDFAAAHANLVRIKRGRTLEDADVRAAAELLGRGALSDGEAALLHFALGEVDDACERYEEAFAHFRRGNEIRRAARRFDPGAFAEYVGRITRTFDEAFFAARRQWGLDSASPVFIVGMPRSGTTLVEQIAASHPQVHGAGEISKVNALVHGLEAAHGGAGAYPDCVRALSQDAIADLAREYLAYSRAGVADTVVRVTDKQLTNLEHLGLITAMLPRAKIVYCRRDPLDTGLSNYFHDFQRGMDYAYDLRDIGLFYRQYERLAAHWRRVLPLDMFEIGYEELVADTPRCARALIAHLQLPWDEACLAFADSRRVVRTASLWQVREPVYRRAVARWRHYARHLGPLREALELN